MQNVSYLSPSKSFTPMWNKEPRSFEEMREERQRGREAERQREEVGLLNFSH